MPVTMTTTTMPVATRTPRTFVTVAHCEHHSHPPAAPKDVDVYHANIRQIETQLQAQYDALHHGGDEASDEPVDDDAVGEADDAEPPEDAVPPEGAEPPEGAGETAAIEGGNSLASSSSDVAQPILAPCEEAQRPSRPACPAPAGPAKPRRQLSITSMFGRRT